MADQNPGPSVPTFASLMTGWPANTTKIFTCNRHLDDVSRRLRMFYENKEFCDIKLIAGVGDFELEAHRMVLSASSGYFKAMFRSNLRDAMADEVKLEQWDGETLKTIVDFMYEASIELRNENVESVLRAADFFQMGALVDACCTFMAEQMETCNCLRLVFFAEQHNYIELYEASLEFACANFERVCNEQEFLELNAEQLCRFLIRDDICVTSEKSVLRSVIAWIKHDEVGRANAVFGVMQHIRYPLLEARFILENRDALCGSFDCQRTVLDWIQYILSPQSRSMFPDAITRPRKTCKKLFFLSGSDASCKVQTFDPEVNEWSAVNWPQPLKRRKFFAPAVVDKKLIIAGGEISGYTSNQAECLDLQTMKWSVLPSMGTPRRWFAMVELDGYLYAVGGIDTMWLRTVVRYDFKTSSWTDVAPMSNALMYVQAVAMDGLLYATCGESRIMECYDPLTNIWTTLPSKREQCAQFALGALGGYLYAVGGHFAEGRSNTVERYDPRTKVWTDVCPLSIARSRISLTAFGNRLIACGGHDGDNFVKIVEEYDPESNEWTRVASLAFDGDSCSHLVPI